MSIASLKESIKEKVEGFSRNNEIFEAKIGTKKFTVSKGDIALSLEKLDETFENHLVVEFYTSQYFSAKELVSTDGIGTFNQIYRLMIAYWREYAKEKGLEGVVVVGDGSRNFVLYHFEGNESEKEREFLEKFIPGQVKLVKREKSTSWDSVVFSRLYGAFLSQNFKEKVATFHELEGLLEEVSNVEKIFARKKIGNNEMFNLYNSEVEFSYLGEDLQISMDFSNELKTKRLIFQREGESRVVEAKPELVLRHLREIEEEKALVNLVEQPKDNFYAYLERELFRYDGFEFVYQETWNREFDALVDLFGGWKEVEKKFVELNTVKTREILYNKDKVSGKKVQVVKTTLHDDTFYFILFRITNKTTDEMDCFIKVTNSDEATKEVENMVTEMVMRNVF